MSVTICTGFGPAGFASYGQKFLDGFNKYWPKENQLVAYTEEPIEMSRGICRSLWDCDGAKDFFERNKDIPERSGRAFIPGWLPKEEAKGYGWRWDALKFFRQCMIPEHAAQQLPDDDILVWLDGDVFTFETLPGRFIEKLIAKNDLIYLGRQRGSEIGFWAVRLNAKTRQFLFSFAEIYRSEYVFKLPEWHSAYVFDYCRQRFEREGGVSQNIVFTHARPSGGHIWMHSPLVNYTDHVKGKRKAAGYSLEHPLKWWLR